MRVVADIPDEGLVDSWVPSWCTYMYTN